MRRTLSLLLALCLCLSLAACREEAEPDPEPIVEVTATPAPVETPQLQPFALAYDPTASLDPVTGDSEVNMALTGLVYQRLYRLDNRFEPEAVLVRSASVSEDGLVWTFAMRSGVVFSDGTPLTADHAADSLNAARTSPLYGNRLSDVSGVRAEGDTLTVTLLRPNGALPALLDIPVALDQEEGPPLGTGCYRYVSKGDELCLERSPRYAGSLPFESIPLVAVTSPEQRIAAFDSGEVAAVTTDFTASYALGFSASYELTDYPTTDMLYVGFRSGDGPCRSALIRRAVARTLDREGIVAAQLAGHADPAALPLSPWREDYDASGRELSYDMERADALLAEAGCSVNEEDGLLYLGREPLALTLIVNSDSAAKQAIAEQIAAGLSELGITVTVNRLAWDSYLAALTAGQFDLYLGEVLLPADFDPSALLTGALNYGGYAAGEELTAALSSWRAAQGDARSRAAAQLWTLLEQEVPIAPVCFKRGSLLTRWGAVSGQAPTRADPFDHIELWQSALSSTNAE